MSNITFSYLSPTSRETVEQLVRRSDYWLELPGEERCEIWQFDGPDGSYSYTGPDLVEFTEANCLAATAASDDKLLTEFEEKLRSEWERSQTTPYEGEDLAQLINDYVVWVDCLFFFGILTRPTMIEGKLSAGRPLYQLLVEEGLYNAEGNYMDSVFFPDTAEWRINSLNSSGEFQDLDILLATVVHEMTHMYLDALTRDDSFKSYYEHVFQNVGHGIQFHELLQFNLTHLFELVPSMLHLEWEADESVENLNFALNQPAVSEADARELIGCCRHHTD